MKKIYLILILSVISFQYSYSQIPNAGFENWTSMGAYSNPDSWSCLNSMTAPMSVYTCIQGSPGHPGSSYLWLESKSVNGMGVVPGIAVCGTMDMVSMQPSGGFPFTSRPVSLDGSWQHMVMGMGGSQGFVDVLLTRWDNMMSMRMPVASAHHVLTGMAMSWETFSIPLTYVENGNPDSCMITFSASGNSPSNMDYLFVDDLTFSGTVSAISETGALINLQISPNPVHSQLSITDKRFSSSDLHIRIFDAQGKLKHETIETLTGVRSGIDVSSLSKGIYLIRIDDEEKTYSGKFLVN